MHDSQLPDNFKVKVDIPIDKDGYLDLECQSEVCEAAFKILLDDWKDKVRDEEVFCPVCRHTTTSDEFIAAQLKYAESMFMAEFQPMFEAEMRRMTGDFNRSMPKDGFIGVSMSWKPSRPVVVVPLEAAELMQQRYTCESCGCQYAAIGAAFFCPSCGHNSVQTALVETLAIIRRWPEIKAALDAKLDRDTAANNSRLMQETNMVKLVTAFERFAEASFKALPNAGDFRLVHSQFQKLPQSSALWEEAIGVRYESMLTPNEWAELQRYFQQRHVLVHNDGIVDEGYLKKTGDQYGVVVANGQKPTILTY